MKITEGQLRRIIRQEVQALRENTSSMPRDLESPTYLVAEDIASMIDVKSLRPGELQALIDRSMQEIKEHLAWMGVYDPHSR